MTSHILALAVLAMLVGILSTTIILDARRDRKAAIESLKYWSDDSHYH